jgi:hypothetical protein
MLDVSILLGFKAKHIVNAWTLLYDGGGGHPKHKYAAIELVKTSSTPSKPAESLPLMLVADKYALCDVEGD